MPITVAPLSGIGIEKLTASWEIAFSDYAIGISMTPEILGTFFKQNGVNFDLSVGAFDEDKLVGLWMNGVREVSGVLTAYDSGTAIWPEYRSKGISKLLSETSESLLRSANVKKYMLEVMQENKTAYNIYAKSGFKVTRDLTCLKAKPLRPNSTARGGISIANSAFTTSLAEKLPRMEYDPTWQNTTSAMLAIADSVRVVTATVAGGIVGFGIVQPARGRISQFGFSDDHWNNETPLLVFEKMSELAQGASEIVIINVDDRAKKSLALLESPAFGFEVMVKQFEMKKDM